MTDFWPGQDPWNSFEQRPAWDEAGEPEHEHDADHREPEAQLAGEAPHDVVFVREAIQRVYHPW